MTLIKRAETWPELWTRLFDTEATESPMKVEEFRENGTLVVRAELPGVDPEKDVEITVENGRLHIHGERRDEKKEETKNGSYRSEFRYGSFDRILPLPPGAGEDAVKATYRDGILEVRLPVDDAAAAAKKIPVAKG